MRVGFEKKVLTLEKKNDGVMDDKSGDDDNKWAEVLEC